MRVLVTGSAGFIGTRVCAELEAQGHTPVECDVEEDVASPTFKPDVDAAIHLAANKYATDGEASPYEVASLNLDLTMAVLARAPKVVLASTCKAADPITCYGASKLICERMVLNAGGTVVRLVNVLGSSGSVTHIWDAVPKNEPIPVTDCTRHFIQPHQAAELLVRALDLPSGRYGPRQSTAMEMAGLANMLHPGRPIKWIPLRFGDRPVERLCNEYEQAIPYMGVTRIVDAWEQEQEAAA